MPQYTNFSDVKQILQVGNQDADYFSDSIERVIVRDGNGRKNFDLIFDTTEVQTPSDLSQSVELEIEITGSNPPYNYDVYEKTDTQGVKRKIETGDTGSDVTISKYNIEIKSAVWGGTIEKGDTIDVEFGSMISEDQAKQLIDEAEIMIDAGVRKAGVRLEKSGNNRVFQSNNVPQEVALACRYLAAFYIYLNVFAEDIDSLKPTSGPARWKQRASEYVDRWMDQEGHVAPKVSSLPPIVDQIGVEDNIGPGFGAESSNLSDLDRDALIDEIFNFDSN